MRFSITFVRYFYFADDPIYFCPLDTGIGGYGSKSGDKILEAFFEISNF